MVITETVSSIHDLPTPVLYPMDVAPSYAPRPHFFPLPLPLAAKSLPTLTSRRRYGSSDLGAALLPFLTWWCLMSIPICCGERRMREVLK